MKKYIYLILALLGGWQVFAQDGPYQIGPVGTSNREASLDNGQPPARIYIGSPLISSPQHYPVVVSDGDTNRVMAGMPYSIAFFPKVFDRSLFSSKGYYAEHVLLRWFIVSMEDRIKKILIYRKALGSTEDSTLVASLAGDASEWEDKLAEKGVLYKYTVFAKGIADDLRVPFINVLEGNGMAMPVATASGRVTFEGGTAVEGVTVRAEAEGDLAGKSLYLNGEDAYLRALYQSTKQELNQGFTWQAWVRPTGTGLGTLFSRGSGYELTYAPDLVKFRVGDKTLQLPITAPTDTFFHVSASYSVDSLYLSVRVSDEVVWRTATPAGTQPAASEDDYLMGRGAVQGQNHFEGYLDEVRLWNRALTDAEITRDYSRYITGKEKNLLAYWRFNEGIGVEFYDLARTGVNYHEYHGFIHKALWRDTVPLTGQLAFRGVTDAEGNYTIAGFPYETGGSLYKFTPMLDQHKFDPNQQLRFVSDDAAIINGLDFKDISSFTVSGTIRYRNSKFPVEGVSILIDGKAAVNQDGQLILSDNQGRFSVDVPIGPHSLRVNKNLHEFAHAGRFPHPTAQQDVPTFNFQEPLAGLEFIDHTLVKVAGRVTGGPVQAAKPLGFGQSTNNLGSTEIHLTSQKGFDLTLADSAVTYTDRHLSNTAEFKTRYVKVMPDAATGEFVAYLPPEKYTVTSVTGGNYTLIGNDNALSLDITSFLPQDETVEDTVQLKVKGVVSPDYPPFDSTHYLALYEYVRGDSTWTVGVDSFYFDKRQDFIHRVRPSITVTNQDGTSLFGDKEYAYKDVNLGSEATIPLIQGGAYTFGYPVFTQRTPYTLLAELYEEYVHSGTGAVDRVPVTDGKLEIVNNLAITTEKEVVTLDGRGRAKYTFKGGLPDISTNALNPALNYTKTLNITAVSGQNGALKTIWREGDPFRAYVFGGMPTGNNFVTTGPTEIVTILRDPPGSGSNASLAKGTSISTAKSWSVNNAFAQDGALTFNLGQEVKTFAGIGAGVITEFDYSNDVTIGLSAEEAWTSDRESVTTITTTQTWSTSDDADYVGHAGDVFVGYATNIIYGLSRNLQPIPTSQCQTCDGPEYNNYKLGLKNALRVSPEFGTSFLYTQGFIEEQLLPNLKEVRNSFLIYSSKPDTLQAQDKPLYISKVPLDDPRFGSDNHDESVWKEQAISSQKQWGNGPSYQIKLPAAWVSEGRSVNDTVHYYNRALDEWTYWLAKNEEEKVKATLEENLSFDGGASYSKTLATERSETSSRTFEWFVSPSVGVNFGQDFNGFGMAESLTLTYSRGGSDSETETEVETTEYNYTLADGESVATDYYSVDVMKPKDGFGPVFKVRGGASSCPFQGNYLTKYYRPGKFALDEATLQIEMPELQVEQALVADVPENRPAVFNLLLKNNSESRDDVIYILSVDEESNPYGAILEVDGANLAAGRGILVPAGVTLVKTLKLWKGRDDVMDYEDIKLRFASRCDDDISSEITVSAYFLPGCSDIAISQPRDQWVVNTNTLPAQTLTVTLDNYDRNYSAFHHVLFQYKPASSSQWITQMTFYNPNVVTPAEYAGITSAKQWINDVKIVHAWDMSSLPDRAYDIRAVSVCDLGSGATAETATDVLHGIKDVKRPKLFGTPQPADGILLVGDEISIQFDEPIEAGLLTPFNFSLKGVLNGTPLDHLVSVKLDGANDYVRIANGVDLHNRSFTVEFWLKRDELNRESVVFSKGSAESDAFEVGFTADNRLFMRFNGEEKRTTALFNDQEWHHYAVTYDVLKKTTQAYCDDRAVLENVPVAADYRGAGGITVGKSVWQAPTALRGNVHDLRIWTKALPLGDVYARMFSLLNGSEVGLAGYWPLDEAFGTLGNDKARYRHAHLFAGWEVLPRGRALALDGTGALEINTGSTVILSNEMDYSLEFWFKARPGQTATTLFSSGKGDGTDQLHDPAYSVSVGFNEAGKLRVLNNGFAFAQQNGVDYRDDNWHHFTLSLSRSANATMLVDAQQVATTASVNFGGLTGTTMWVGARGYRNDQGTKVQDQYFEGVIDEVRLWKLARRQAQVALDWTSKLSGTEKGLVAYYPFEYYKTEAGIRILEGTLADQWQNPYGPNGGQAVVSGGASVGTEAANLRDVRPLQAVDFDWAVNEDKIIITPAARMAKAIDKTILEIIVEGVEDKFENRLASPVAWTAYVDRNLLKWSDDQLTFEKPLYAPMQFTVEITNHGGTQQRFSLENLPPWLTAQPSAGEIAPLSSQAVRFTVNEGLNTGYFGEDIYLRSDFGADEKLHIDLRVFAEEPAWAVDPADYQYSMNMVAQLEIDGILSSDVYDRVGVFVGDECRGVADLQYIEAYDLYEVFLDIYSNQESGETVEFRVWNADEATEHRDVQPILTFTSNQVLGTPRQPEKIRAGATYVQSMHFNPGWNWVSFNLDAPLLSSVQQTLTTVAAQVGDQAKGQTTVDIFTPGIGWSGTLSGQGGFRNGQMYMVKLQQGGDIQLVGRGINPDLSIPIRTGWNWIGVNPRFNLTVNEAFANFNPQSGDMVKSQFAFAVYDDNLGWTGSLRYLKPGLGYMFRSAQPGALVYPAQSALTQTGDRLVALEQTDVPTFWQYPYTQSVIAWTAEAVEGHTYRLEAWAGATLRGVTTRQQVAGSPLYFLTVHGEQNGETIRFRLIDETDDLAFAVQETLPFASDELRGTLEEPFALTVQDLVTHLPEQRLDARLYPNPFRQNVQIEVPKTGLYPPQIHVTDLLGRVLTTLNVQEGTSGWEAVWEAQPQPAGMYLIVVEHEGQQQVYKVTKQ
ncbi:Por secretion system C-terminal sorting domain-containing protein [Catalinimonas alkaloidigena]|uniref:Por secretion system C-terminal sorting domain-containing protein n=1 Tax=Catalinimonas alkaloidigena TaxID=1075417 RepID=A0A1G8XGC1_9BACT|nr:LamG-like jellyroll fold domain-containing protein [Catalinimonas alkaloidigena]SDJ89531.1 Por secretion system C-terminal sorting domain-containing protein [Catalinimonas alkaloidigena]